MGEDAKKLPYGVAICYYCCSQLDAFIARHFALPCPTKSFTQFEGRTLRRMERVTPAESH